MKYHNGNANKMVGETPRTETYVLNPLPQVVSAEWARELERELNAATSEIERLTAKVAQLYEGAEEQRQRIKRLEEAGDMMADLLDGGVFMKYAVQWYEAKEDKP